MFVEHYLFLNETVDSFHRRVTLLLFFSVSFDDVFILHAQHNKIISNKCSSEQVGYFIN